MIARQSSLNCFFCSSVIPAVIFSIDFAKASSLDVSTRGAREHPTAMRSEQQTADINIVRSMSVPFGDREVPKQTRTCRIKCLQADGVNEWSVFLPDTLSGHSPLLTRRSS